MLQKLVEKIKDIDEKEMALNLYYQRYYKEVFIYFLTHPTIPYEDKQVLIFGYLKERYEK